MNEELKKLLAWFDNYEITFNEIRLSPCQYIFDLRNLSLSKRTLSGKIGTIRHLSMIF